MTTENLLPEGRYTARVTDAVLGRTSGGNEQIAIGFEILLPEVSAGRNITYYGSLSDTVISAGKNQGRRVAELTFDALDVVGWDGVDFASGSLQTCIGHEASIVVAHEDDNHGNPRAKVKFINGPNSGGAAVKDRVNDNDAANATRKFSGLLAKRKQEKAAKARANGTATPPAKPKGVRGEDYIDDDPGF